MSVDMSVESEAPKNGVKENPMSFMGFSEKKPSQIGSRFESDNFGPAGRMNR